MFLTDFIRVYDNAMPTAVCDDIITRFDALESVEEVKLEAQDPSQPPVRSHLEINISKDEAWKDVQGMMMKLCELCVGKYQVEVPNKVFPAELGCETYRLKKYRAGEGFNDLHAYHVDVNNHASARRFLSVMWYLNDVPQGGDTFFPHPNIRIKPKKSRIVMFPSLWMYPHSEEKPISNDKYVIETYLHYL